MSQHLSEGLELLGLPLPLVEHLCQRLELGQSQLQGHAVVVAVRGVLQQVLRATINYKGQLCQDINRKASMIIMLRYYFFLANYT